MRRVIGNWLIRNWKKWAVTSVAVLLGAIWIVMARGASPVPGFESDARADVAVRFGAVDVMVDTGTKKLGAYQVEVVTKNAKVVGVEGGESIAFNPAPYYDPAALQGGKIVVAAFSTDDALPNGLTRVARLHFMLEGAAGGVGGMPDMASKLVVATDADGKNVDAKLSLRPFEGEKR